MQSTLVLTYRIAPELRRCCWHVIAGALTSACLGPWIAQLHQNRDPLAVATACTGFGLLAAAMAVPLRWRLRVDERGLARRLLFGWSVWPWSDLASGRISKRQPYTLFDPARPVWGRRLRLGFLAADDLREVMAAINQHYQLPPPPECPDRLTVKYGFRRSATFDDKGILLLVGDTPHEFVWKDLEHVHITRMDPVRRDSKSLLIRLPEQEIELKLLTHQGGTSPTWKGATSEEIDEFLLQHVDPKRLFTFIAGERLSNREQIERKLAAAKKSARELKIVMAAFGPLIGAFWCGWQSMRA